VVVMVLWRLRLMLEETQSDAVADPAHSQHAGHRQAHPEGHPEECADGRQRDGSEKQVSPHAAI
jgi:hypothetical protein